MTPSSNCYDIIKKWEGLRLKAYKCASNIWTIGYGHTKGVKEGDIISTIQADELLVSDVVWAANAANHLFENGLNQNQFDAVVSIIFNMGKPRFMASKLCTLIMYNAYNEAIKTEWLNTGVRNNKGEVLKGLQARRKDEIKLYSL